MSYLVISCLFSFIVIQRKRICFEQVEDNGFKNKIRPEQTNILRTIAGYIKTYKNSNYLAVYFWEGNTKTNIYSFVLYKQH